jgi:pSer/pThr/pTyr-binding forkhead associated (FHA) protein
MGSEETTSLPRPKCPNCDHIGAIGARFCSNCGTRLDASAVADATGALPEPATAAASGAQAVVGDLPESGAVLVVSRGADAGARHLLHGDIVTVGRSNDSDVFLDDVTVSRNHAELLHGSSGWMLRDRRSLNGSYVNGERMDEARLSNGDTVQIGKYIFIFWAAE